MSTTTFAPAKLDSSFGQTLQFITSIKLHELEKHRLAYQDHAKVIDKANAYGEAGDIIKKVQVLAKAIGSWTGSGSLSYQKIVGGKLKLADLQFWLQQAEKDPSFSREIAQGWAETLEAHINHTKRRFDCAKLFGNLFNEWLASGDSSASSLAVSDDSGSATPIADSVEVGRKEMHEQREKLESIIFDDHPVDVDALNEYLEDLFEPEEAAKALEKLRKELKDHGYKLQRQTITRDDVVNAITGILASGLMSEEKRDTLRAFKENPIVLDELASVLNMRLASLDSWSWPQNGVLVEMRRHLNGKYRASTDPEIIDALLFHIIGISWQVKLKAALRRLFDSKAWKRSSPPTRDLKEKYQSQLRGSHSIESQRRKCQSDSFFVSQLADSATSGGAASYDGVVDSRRDGFANLRGGCRGGPLSARSIQSRGRASSPSASPVTIKQQLLHSITTECYLDMALHGTHAIICSDLEWFGPSLPHTSILTVLEFLGMSKKWLSFYKTFLVMPVRFSEDTEPRVRKRGTPISYELSVVCGEAILFIMDFAVNQRTDGLHLYRMHDDLWLWDADADNCADGWEEMNDYAELVGLKFNETKTGSAYVGSRRGYESSRLPNGDVRWGFLKFEPSQARFVIDQKDVDNHIAELRRQLAATKSVFGWINAYNTYMSFFLRNFGGIPANCLGQKHAVDIIDTLAKIQRDLFAETGDGSAVDYLRRILHERFDVDDLPEGYFYFPISSGGLELHNTMLEILSLSVWHKPFSTFPFHGEDAVDDQVAKADEDDFSGLGELSYLEHPHDDTTTSTEALFSRILNADEKSYTDLKEMWDNDPLRRRWHDEFIDFSEYLSLRESWLSSWGDTYQFMFQSPSQNNTALVPHIKAEIEKGFKSWEELKWYDQWVLSMYGEEVVKKFGALEAVDRNLIPIGMVQLWKNSRIKLYQ